MNTRPFTQALQTPVTPRFGKFGPQQLGQAVINNAYPRAGADSKALHAALKIQNADERDSQLLTLLRTLDASKTKMDVPTSAKAHALCEALTLKVSKQFAFYFLNHSRLEYSQTTKTLLENPQVTSTAQRIYA